MTHVNHWFSVDRVCLKFANFIETKLFKHFAAAHIVFSYACKNIFQSALERVAFNIQFFSDDFLGMFYQSLSKPASRALGPDGPYQACMFACSFPWIPWQFI